MTSEEQAEAVEGLLAGYQRVRVLPDLAAAGHDEGANNVEGKRRNALHL